MIVAGGDLDLGTHAGDGAAVEAVEEGVLGADGEVADTAVPAGGTPSVPLPGNHR